MIQRALQRIALQSLQQFPVVGLIGSRQMGKTTLAKAIQKSCKKESIYLDLELPSDLKKLENSELYLGQYADRLVIIDEIQQMPELFPLLRALVDQHRKNGRFLILGSASPHLRKRASESLAGRIIYHELQSLSLQEIGAHSSSIQKRWLRGGYPISFLARTDALSWQWRKAFLKSYVERDIPQLGIHIPSARLRRFLTMVAHYHGQLWNASGIAGSLGLSYHTVNHYLDLLEDTFIVRRLQPYYINLKKRIVKSPKIFLRDTGLLHSLLEIPDWDYLQSHPVLGSSWEGFAVEQIFNLLPSPDDVYFFKTHAGAEIDCLWIKNQKAPIAIEVKYSLSPGLSKGFWQAYKDLGCQRGYIVYPGKDSYEIGRGVRTLPIHKITDILHS